MRIEALSVVTATSIGGDRRYGQISVESVSLYGRGIATVFEAINCAASKVGTRERVRIVCENVTELGELASAVGRIVDESSSTIKASAIRDFFFVHEVVVLVHDIVLFTYAAIPPALAPPETCL